MKPNEAGILVSSKEETRNETSGDYNHGTAPTVESKQDTTSHSTNSKISSFKEISESSSDSYNHVAASVTKSNPDTLILPKSFETKSLNGISQSYDEPDFQRLRDQIDICDHDSYTTALPFKYEIECCGDSVTRERSDNSSKYLSSEEKSAGSKQSRTMFNTIKAVHVDIPPEASLKSSGGQCGDSETQNIYEIRVFKDEISVGTTIILDITDHALASNYKIHASAPEEFPHDVRVSQASASDFEEVEKPTNKLRFLPDQRDASVSRTAFSFNSSLLKRKFTSKAPKVLVKWRSDPNIFLRDTSTFPVKRRETSESFTQTNDTYVKRKKKKSKFKRALEVLFFSCGRCCV